MSRRVVKAVAIGLAIFGSVVGVAARQRNIELRRKIVMPHHVAADDARPAEQPEPKPACPLDMILVEGPYCTKVDERCLHWLDDPKLPFARCGVFAKPTRCVGPTVGMRYCIDRYEYTSPGERLPKNDASFFETGRVCGNLEKRACTEAEWNFACEGTEMRPYPYGWERQPVCNQDRLDLVEQNGRGQVLRDWREPADARQDCVSPFGVYNMVGNLDESVLRDLVVPGSRFRSALKGGWWMPARNRCRPATTAHDDDYHGLQVGIRCCANAPSERMEGGATIATESPDPRAFEAPSSRRSATH